MQKELIEIYGAREHNLKNIDVKIPRDQQSFKIIVWGYIINFIYNTILLIYFSIN